MAVTRRLAATLAGAVLTGAITSCASTNQVPRASTAAKSPQITQIISGVDNQSFVLDYLGFSTLHELVQKSTTIAVARVRGVVATRSADYVLPEQSGLPPGKRSKTGGVPTISVQSVVVQEVLKGKETVGDELTVPETGTTIDPLMVPDKTYLLFLLTTPAGGKNYFEAGGPEQGRYLIDTGGYVRGTSYPVTVGTALVDRKFDEIRGLLK